MSPALLKIINKALNRSWDDGFNHGRLVGWFEGSGLSWDYIAYLFTEGD